MNYCTARDLIAHANRANLITQLAGNDYGALPAPAATLDYFETGNAAPGYEDTLAALKARTEQAITLASGDIDGYLALLPGLQLPPQTLHAACMDMALFRLCERLEEESVIKQLNDSRHAYFNRLITGRAAVKNNPGYGSAQTAAPAAVFTDEQLRGY